MYLDLTPGIGIRATGPFFSGDVEKTFTAHQISAVCELKLTILLTTLGKAVKYLSPFNISD